MKILIIQEYSQHKENVLYRECLCFQRAFQYHGWEADVWGLGHSNFEQVPDFNSYDVILTCENYGEWWLPNLTSFNRPYKFFYAIDPHVRGIDIYQQIVNYMGYNFLFVAVRDFSIGENRAWLPPAADDELFVKKDLPKDIPLGFVGNLVNREHILKYLVNTRGLQMYNKIFGDEMVNLLNRFNISFNKNMSNDTNYRSFETIACGSLLVTNNNPAYTDMGFQNGKNCFMYNDFWDMLNVVDHISKQPELIASVAAAGYEFSKQNSYKTRVGGIISFLENKL